MYMYDACTFEFINTCTVQVQELLCTRRFKFVIVVFTSDVHVTWPLLARCCVFIRMFSIEDR